MVKDTRLIWHITVVELTLSKYTSKQHNLILTPIGESSAKDIIEAKSLAL
jgi:hypothetical protein